MKVVMKTDEYTILQRRDARYAVRGADRSWVNGDAKIAILSEHNLIQAAPKPQPAPAETGEAEDAPAADAAASDAEEEAGDAAEDAGDAAEDAE